MSHDPISRELRYWRRARMHTLADKLTLAAMLLILVVGLLAVWSVQ